MQLQQLITEATQLGGLYLGIAIFSMIFIEGIKWLPGLRDAPTRFIVLLLTLLISFIIGIGMALNAIPKSYPMFFTTLLAVLSSPVIYDRYFKDYIREPISRMAKTAVFGKEDKS